MLLHDVRSRQLLTKIALVVSGLASMHAGSCGGSSDIESTGNVYVLTTGVTGEGRISIQVAEGDTDSCVTGTCTLNVPEHRAVTLVPVPGAGWTFAGWQGTCTSPVAQSSSCGALSPGGAVGARLEICMTQALSCAATFVAASGPGSGAGNGGGSSPGSGSGSGSGGSPTPPPPPTPPPTSGPQHTLALKVTGRGTVQIDPGSVVCAADCNQSFGAEVNEVTLTAAPATGGWKVAAWNGDCSLSSEAGESSVHVAMSGDRRCEVVFADCSDPTPPIAAFKVNPSPAVAGHPVTLDATESTGAIAAYLWTATWPNQRQILSQPVVTVTPPSGAYSVSLTVRDYCGRESQPVQHPITVQ